MNSTFNKTNYTCFTESLFQKHKEISGRATKLGSFLYVQHTCFIDMVAAFEK